MTFKNAKSHKEIEKKVFLQTEMTSKEFLAHK